MRSMTRPWIGPATYEITRRYQHLACKGRFRFVDEHLFCESTCFFVYFSMHLFPSAAGGYFIGGIVIYELLLEEIARGCGFFFGG